MTFENQTEELHSKLSICVLASGSSGNSIYISDTKTSILIDAGLSGVKIENRLASKGLCVKDLDAIVVSHEHSDHIRGVGVLARRYDIPIYISKETYGAASSALGRIDNLEHFDTGADFKIESMLIHPFPISHDAVDPAGFTVRYNGNKIGIATDLGIATSVVRSHLRDCDTLIVEANHDPQMLMTGPYPWSLKQRVKGRRGHLSNFESRLLLEDLMHDKLSCVILAHLSGKNNTPQKALEAIGPLMEHCNVNLEVACQDVCTELIQV